MGKTGGLRAYRNKRDAVEGEIVDALRKAGCSVTLMDKPVDLLVGYRGRTFLAEVKTGKGKPTKSQVKFAQEWRGGDVYIIRTAEEALTVLCLLSIRTHNDREAA